jgi:hypothetical protein
MTTATFDTLKFTEQLIEAGYTEQQAKGTVRAYQAAHEGLELATKSDIAYLKADIASLAKETKSEINLKIVELKNQLIMWLGGMLTVSVSVIVWFIERHHV